MNKKTCGKCHCNCHCGEPLHIHFYDKDLCTCDNCKCVKQKPQGIVIDDTNECESCQ